jgi:hypothetical protein
MAESEAWQRIKTAREALQEMSATMTKESQDKFVKEIQALRKFSNNSSPNINKNSIENQIESMISEGYAILDEEHETKRELLAAVQGKNYRQTSKLRKRRNVNYTNALPKENLKILRNSKRRRKQKANYKNALAAVVPVVVSAPRSPIILLNNSTNTNTYHGNTTEPQSDLEAPKRRPPPGGNNTEPNSNHRGGRRKTRRARKH